MFYNHDCQMPIAKWLPISYSQSHTPHVSLPMYLYRSCTFTKDLFPKSQTFPLGGESRTQRHWISWGLHIVAGLKVSIIIPWYILTNDFWHFTSNIWSSPRGQAQPLLYLTGQPIVEGPGSCHYVSEVNTHNIKVSDEKEGEDDVTFSQKRVRDVLI